MPSSWPWPHDSTSVVVGNTAKGGCGWTEPRRTSCARAAKHHGQTASEGRGRPSVTGTPPGPQLQKQRFGENTEDPGSPRRHCQTRSFRPWAWPGTMCQRRCSETSKRLGTSIPEHKPKVRLMTSQSCPPKKGENLPERLEGQSGGDTLPSSQSGTLRTERLQRRIDSAKQSLQGSYKTCL